VCWAISLPILVFLALLVLELFTMYATDRRTDGRTKATLNAPYPTGGGIIIHRICKPCVDHFSMHNGKYSFKIIFLNKSLKRSLKLVPV